MKHSNIASMERKRNGGENGQPKWTFELWSRFGVLIFVRYSMVHLHPSVEIGKESLSVGWTMDTGNTLESEIRLREMWAPSARTPRDDSLTPSTWLRPTPTPIRLILLPSLFSILRDNPTPIDHCRIGRRQTSVKAIDHIQIEQKVKTLGTARAMIYMQWGLYSRQWWRHDMTAEMSRAQTTSIRL